MIVELTSAQVQELKDAVITAGVPVEGLTDSAIRDFSFFCQAWAEEDHWTFTLQNFKDRLFRVFGRQRALVNNAILGRFVATERLSNILGREALNGVKEGIDILSWQIDPESLLAEKLTRFVDLVGQKYAGKNTSGPAIKALASEISHFGLEGIDVIPYLRSSIMPLADAVKTLASARTYLPYFELVRYLPEAPPFLPVEGWLSRAKSSVPELWQTRVGELPNGVSLEMLLEILPPETVDAADLGAFRRAITLHNLGQKPPKPFAFGKRYLSASVDGLKERRDGFETAWALVNSLISLDKERAASAAELFEREAITAAQAFTAHHSVSRRAMYRKVQPYLAGLTAGDENAALKVLGIFRSTYDHHVIRDLVAGVESLFSLTSSFDTLAVRTQSGTLDDIFDNRTLMACPFFPRGEYKYASLDYLLHQDLALLHLVPLRNGVEGKPIGVAILAIVEDVRGKKYLLVDSVEGGEELQRIRDSVWEPLVTEAIKAFAGSVEGLEKEILVNCRFTGGSSIPRKVLHHFLSDNYQTARMRLRLPHLTETPVYLEAFQDKATHRFKQVRVYALNPVYPSLQELDVRYAQMADLKEILAIESSRLPEHQQDPDSLIRTLKSGGVNLVCTDSYGKIVGYMLSYSDGGQIHIEHVSTRQGYPFAFKRLIRRFGAEVLGHGYHTVSLLARKEVGIDKLVEKFGGITLGEEHLGTSEGKEAYVRMTVDLLHRRH